MSGNVVYTVIRTGTVGLSLGAMSADTGTVLWNVPLLNGGTSGQPATLTVGGGLAIISLGGHPGFDETRTMAVRLADHTRLWTWVNASSMALRPTFVAATSTTPAMVLATTAAPGVDTTQPGKVFGALGLHALDAATGRQIWFVDDADLGPSWATNPAVGGGRAVYSVYTADPFRNPSLVTGRIRAVELATGHVAWSRNGTYPIDSVLANGLVFTMNAKQTLILRSADGSGIARLPYESSDIAVANGRLYLGGTPNGGTVLGLPTEHASVDAVDDVTPGPGPTPDQEKFTFSAGWWTAADPTDFRGTDHRSLATNATATMKYTGTNLRYWWSAAPNRGVAAISVDGGPETLINQYSPAPTGRLLSWTSPQLGNTTHTVTIRVTGQKAPSATADLISVDKIDIGR